MIFKSVLKEGSVAVARQRDIDFVGIGPGNVGRHVPGPVLGLGCRIAVCQGIVTQLNYHKVIYANIRIRLISNSRGYLTYVGTVTLTLESGAYSKP